MTSVYAFNLATSEDYEVTAFEHVTPSFSALASPQLEGIASTLDIALVELKEAMRQAIKDMLTDMELTPSNIKIFVGPVITPEVGREHVIMKGYYTDDGTIEEDDVDVIGIIQKIDVES